MAVISANDLLFVKRKTNLYIRIIVNIPASAAGKRVVHSFRPPMATNGIITIEYGVSL